MQIPLFRQIIIKKLRRSSRIFSAAPPEFLGFCFELFNENFQVRLSAAARLMPVRMSTAWPIVRSQEHPGRETCICAWKPSVPYMRKEGTAAEAKRRSTAHMAKEAAAIIFARKAGRLPKRVHRMT